jgi:hypothetical protein
MRIIAIINDDQMETYKDRKSGAERKTRVLSLVDVGEGTKLKQIITWAAPDTLPVDKSLVGERVTLDVTELNMFGSIPRVRAVVVGVIGAAARPQVGKG